MLDKVGEALLDKLSKTAFWEWFVKKYLSSYTLRFFGYPKFPMDDFFKIVDRLDKNEIYCFVCSDYESLGSKIIRSISDSKFTHAGFILPGDDRSIRCVHMRSIGLQNDHLLSLLREVDYIAVVAPDIKCPEDHLEARTRLQAILDHESEYYYDFEERLDNGAHKLYCSELIFDVLGGAMYEQKLQTRNYFRERSLFA